MKTKRLQRIISAVMVLAMLVGTLGVLSFGGAAGAETASETETANRNFTISTVYNTQTLWKSKSNNMLWKPWGSVICHKTENYSAILRFDGTDDDVTAKYDADNLALKDIKYVQWMPKNSSSWSTGENAHVTFSFQLYYDSAAAEAGTFDGFVIQRYRSGGIAKVDQNGRFYTYTEDYQSQVEIGQLADGWNDITCYFIPTYKADGSSVDHYDIYFSMAAYGTTVTEEALSAMPSLRFDSTSPDFSKVLTNDGNIQFGNDVIAGGTGTFSMRYFKAGFMYVQNNTKNFSYADNYYQSDWANSTLDLTNGYMVNANGTKDAIKWTPNEALNATLEDGVLTTSGVAASTLGLQLVPSQMSQNTLTAGVTYLSFDIYINADHSNNSPTFKIGGEILWWFQPEWYNIYYRDGWVNNINGNSKIGFAASASSKEKTGWATLEMVLVPQTIYGEICTSPDQEVFANVLYMRGKYLGADGVASTAVTDVSELKGFYKVATMTSAKHVGQYVDLCQAAGTYLGNASTTQELKIRNFKSANLVETVVNEEVEATQTGYGFNEKRFEPDWVGKTLHYTGWNGTWVEGDGGWNGAFEIPLPDGWNEDKTAPDNRLVFDSEAGTMTIKNSQSWNSTTFKPQTRQNYNFGIVDGPVRIKVDVLWEEGNADSCYNGGFKFSYFSRNLFYVAPKTGVVTYRYGTVTETIGQMVDGWNTIEMYLFPMVENGDGSVSISTSSSDTLVRTDYYAHVYQADNGPFEKSTGITKDYLNDFHCIETDIVKHFSSTDYANTDGRFETVNSGNNFTIRRLSAMCFTEQELYTVRKEADSYTKKYYVAPGGSYTVPAATENASLWLMGTNGDKTQTLVAPESTITVNGNVTLRGGNMDNTIRIGAANITLSGSMALSMRVKNSVLTAAPEEMFVFVDGTTMVGKRTDGTLAMDEFGYYGVEVKDILAADMGKDKVYHLVVKVDGRYLFAEETRIYSPMKYATNMMKKDTTSAEVKELLATMMNYGAVAETQRYGTSIIRNAMTEVGVATLPTLPASASYVREEMTSDDKAIINGYVNTGALLTNGINIAMVPVTDGQLSGVRVTSGGVSREYAIGEDGVITIEGISPVAIRTLYRITFIGADGEDLETATFSIGTFLEARRTAEGVSEDEKAIVEATILYMWTVRNYGMNAN